MAKSPVILARASTPPPEKPVSLLERVIGSVESLVARVRDLERKPLARDGRDGSPGRDGKDGIGIDGQPGPQGPQGNPGIDGQSGPQGLTGPCGPQGSQGPEGRPGPAGPEGQIGSDGPQGPAGPQGQAGAAGPEGQRGPAGVGIADVVMQSDGLLSVHLTDGTIKDVGRVAVMRSMAVADLSDAEFAKRISAAIGVEVQIGDS